MVRMKHCCLLVFLFVWLGGWRLGCARDSMGSAEDGRDGRAVRARGALEQTVVQRREREDLWEGNGAGTHEIISIRGAVDSRDVMEIVGVW